MKIFILVSLFLAGAFAFSIDDVDLENVIPIYEAVEFQAAFPELAAAVKAANAEKPSMTTFRSGRIWGGQLAEHGELPYQVGILVLLVSTSFCGGAIVGNNFVVTAASCFPGDPNAIIEVGSVDRLAVGQFINAGQKILHPAFDPSTSDNDIALVRLVVPVTFTETVRPVRLPNRRQVSQTFENQQARISGWGALGVGSALQRFLRIGFAQVVSQAACRIRFPTSSSDRTLCIDGTDVNFCNGDFGGPVTIQDADGITTQIGVKSFTAALGCAFGFPGGMTRLSMYLEWIAANSDVTVCNDFFPNC